MTLKKLAKNPEIHGGHLRHLKKLNGNSVCLMSFDV